MQGSQSAVSVLDAWALVTANCQHKSMSGDHPVLCLLNRGGEFDAEEAEAVSYKNVKNSEQLTIITFFSTEK